MGGKGVEGDGEKGKGKGNIKGLELLEALLDSDIWHLSFTPYPLTFPPPLPLTMCNHRQWEENCQDFALLRTLTHD